jgi:hypothetical protein
MWELIIVSSPEEFFIIRKHFLSDNSVELSVTNYGIGAAIQIFDGFSLAVSPRWSWMTAKLHSIFNGGNVGIGEYEEIIDDDDSEFSLNAGLLWSPHPRVSIGAVYKIGAEFAVKPTLVTIQEPNDPVFSDYEPDFADKFTLKVPDSFGIGVAFRATDFLTFTLDAVHIQYKDLLKDFDVPGYIGLGHPEEYVVNNATEIHIGVEYILPLGKEFLALRAGIYNDPAHNIRRYSDSYEPMTYSPRGEDQIHVTGGLGIIHSDRFQIDTAVDIADKRKQFSFSMVYRFGGGRSKTRDTKPNLTSAPPPKPIEEVHPSVTFTVVKFDKTLEIQSVTTETPGVSDVNVTIKQAGKTSFIVTAALEKGREKLTTDIRIDIEQQKFKAEEMDQRGQVKVLSEKQKSLEVMVTFK